VENERNIKRYSADELRAKRAKGESKTDFAALALKTDEQIESENASDDEFQGVPEDWHEMAEAVMPASKQLLSLRLDKEVVEWFRARGPGYQTRMNAVLRAFVMHEEKDKKRA
jgi:uncharacterized protein (DUF4415 family)